MIENIIAIILSLVTGFIFIKSSSGKIKNPYAFGKVIETYDLKLKGNIALIFAIIMGPLEFITGVMIFFEVSRYYGLILATLLQLVFIVMMILRYNKILPFGCGCFGLHGPQKINKSKLIFNISYMVLILVNLYIFEKL
ncbi:MauE/DoxX family redox-associated membrane protein [Priestia megaterium]|uniref:MauE/DoxX family redox-associated membrane protein n=1 Tax=Priestia megaterium TaxID=1404 RepID=UPI003670EC94